MCSLLKLKFHRLVEGLIAGRNQNSAALPVIVAGVRYGRNKKGLQLLVGLKNNGRSRIKRQESCLTQPRAARRVNAKDDIHESNHSGSIIEVEKRKPALVAKGGLS